MTSISKEDAASVSSLDDLEPGELRPCPFCGGQAEVYEFDDVGEDDENFGGSAIVCTRCQCSTAVHFDRKEHLHPSWNERVPDRARAALSGVTQPAEFKPCVIEYDDPPRTEMVLEDTLTVWDHGFANGWVERGYDQNGKLVAIRINTRCATKGSPSQPTTEVERDWLDDSDRFFDDEWEDLLGEVVLHCSTEKRLIIERDGERCALTIEVPGAYGDAAGEIGELIVKAVNGFSAHGWIVGNGDGTKWRHWTDCGPEWVTDRNSATRFARREDAEDVHAGDEDAWTVERFSNAPTGFEKLLKAAEAIKQMKFDRYKKRNGHEAGIEADDGEKCWIVHSDQISALEFAIKEARSALGEARVSEDER